VPPRPEIRPDGGGGGGCGGGGGGLGTPPAFAKEHFHMVWIVMAYSRFTRRRTPDNHHPTIRRSGGFWTRV
jgi:hypothetical protein